MYLINDDSLDVVSSSKYLGHNVSYDLKDDDISLKRKTSIRLLIVF